VKVAAWLVAALIAPAPPMPSTPSGSSAATQELRACLAGGIDPFHDDRCYNRHVKRREMRLERVLVQTRQYLARRERETSRPGALAMADVRRSPAYLDRSQAALARICRTGLHHAGRPARRRQRLDLARDAQLLSRGARPPHPLLESIASGAFTAP
jgi:hypothetical protein